MDRPCACLDRRPLRLPRGDDSCAKPLLIYHRKSLSRIHYALYIIRLIYLDNRWAMIMQFLAVFVFAIGDNDDFVADRAASGGCSIEANNACSWRSFDQIRLESLAVVVVNDGDFFVRKHI